MRANSFHIRDSHRVTFDLIRCKECGNLFRYAIEAQACAKNSPDIIAKPFTRVRLSVSNIPGMHNAYGWVLAVEGPVVDQRYDDKDHQIMTYQISVNVDGHGVVNELYSDQAIPLTDDEVKLSLRGNVAKPLEQGQPKDEAPTASSESEPVQPIPPEPVCRNNFEKGFAEGLGEEIDGDEIDPETISFDDFDDDEAVEFDS